MAESQQQTDHIVNEACAWIARLDTGELSVADLAAFRAWMQRSPAHAAEINRLARLYSDLDQLADEPLAALADDVDVIPVAPPTVMRTRLVAGLIGLAATILVTLAVLLPLSQQSPQSNLRLVTPVGGYLEQELTDGSLVRLNTDSAITIDYDTHVRMVHLHQGEVYFDVASNAERPFVVRADEREVRAVGTAFVVRRDAEGLKVMVAEGQVAISQKSRPPTVPVTAPTPVAVAAPILLSAGQRFEDSPNGLKPVDQFPEAELQRQLAWQRGLLEFTDTPLHEVSREVSRYTNLTIRFEDPELRNIRFGGIFPSGETELLFNVLESSYGISVAHIDASTVVLRRAL